MEDYSNSISQTRRNQKVHAYFCILPSINILYIAIYFIICIYIQSRWVVRAIIFFLKERREFYYMLMYHITHMLLHNHDIHSKLHCKYLNSKWSKFYYVYANYRIKSNKLFFSSSLFIKPFWLSSLLDQNLNLEFQSGTAVNQTFGAY